MIEDKIKIKINSEVGALENIIMHTPGEELENMTPETAHLALYSDIISLELAKREYSSFKNILKKHANVLEVRDLLYDILQVEENKKLLLQDIKVRENLTPEIIEYLNIIDTKELVKSLVEGVELKKDTLTKFLDNQSYELPPLHNLFFTRDISIGYQDKMYISTMANAVRKRESIIMEHIFKLHPKINTNTVIPDNPPSPGKNFTSHLKFSFEGGDFVIAREDILLIGTGDRTTSTGIDFILHNLLESKQKGHIIVQELPLSPSSFIHLDMVFTFLDKNQCMVYEPLILLPNRYLTIHIHYDNGKVVFINEVDNIPTILKKLGMDLEILYCGGRQELIEEREQWHSGANFFAMGPGKIMGYGRNVHTIEELNKKGYEVFKATDVIGNNINLNDYNKYVITIEGAELSRGGGGCRCMTMPISRKEI